MTPFKTATAMTALVALSGLTACEQTPEQRARAEMDQREFEARKGEQVSSVCFAGSIDSFSRPRDNSVVVQARIRDEYLLTTSACFNLDNALSLQVESRSGCLSRGDYIVAYDTAFPGTDTTGIEPSRCLITGIYEWKDDSELDDNELGL